MDVPLGKVTSPLPIQTTPRMPWHYTVTPWAPGTSSSSLATRKSMEGHTLVKTLFDKFRSIYLRRHFYSHGIYLMILSYYETSEKKSVICFLVAPDQVYLLNSRNCCTTETVSSLLLIVL
mmetsp:Transcript_22312/g.25367  ORF Transcript_22312/g.25367 Transcript_22312/m.25367 type:complete len:120 (-) Transcript_22312:405-764(-)